MRETRLSLDQFVMPLFVAPEPLANEALPGMARFDIEGLLREAEALRPAESARSSSSASRR